MKPSEIIETDKYIIKIYDQNCYLHFIIKEGIIFSDNDARELKRKVIALRPNVKFFVFAEGIEFFTLTKKARELCATKEHSDNTVAIAFYTANISLLFLGEIYNKINKPAIPTKIFNNRNNAKEWLEQQMKQNGLAVNFEELA